MHEGIVLVDFFDTIMLRHVHPIQITERWAHNIRKKYGLEVSEDQIIKARADCFQKSAEISGETIYRDAMAQMYRFLAKECATLTEKCSEEDFVAFTRKTELALEVGAQYPNHYLLRRIARWKKCGKKVYIVSDFYLGEEDMRFFCAAQEIDFSIFDGIFVSTDYGCSKYSGKLYQKVIALLNCSATELRMIGDNPISDGKMAEKHNIQSELRKRIPYKVILRLRRMRHYNFSHQIGSLVTRGSYCRQLPFGEYISLFFSFIERLKKRLPKGEQAIFLAREGFFLRHLLERYDYYATPIGEENPTEYFLCSRRAITSVQQEKLDQLSSQTVMTVKNYLKSAGFTNEEIPILLVASGLKESLLDETLNDEIQTILYDNVAERVKSNRLALNSYAKQIIQPKSTQHLIHFIDIGWSGSMQCGLESVLGIQTDGFYLGTNISSYIPPRTGLIFSEEEDSKKKTYYSILRTNIQLYELLCAAPHGSAQTYVQKGQTIDVPLEWVKNEKELFISVIDHWQKTAVIYFDAMAAWAPADILVFSNKDNAYTVLRSALFADKSRRRFLRELDKGFVWNFGQEQKGTKYSARSVKIDLSMLYSPEKYVRYFAKIQRLLPEIPLVHWAYSCVAYLFSAYVKTVLRLKGAR